MLHSPEQRMRHFMPYSYGTYSSQATAATRAIRRREAAQSASRPAPGIAASQG